MTSQNNEKLELLHDSSSVTVRGGKYLFNGSDVYDENKRYVLHILPLTH